MSTKPLVDPMTVEWKRSDFAVGMEVMFNKNDAERAKAYGYDLSRPYKIIQDDGSNITPFRLELAGQRGRIFDAGDLVPLSKIREYEAAQSAQNGPMEPKQVKPPKPTICEVALREARERVDGLVLLKDIQDGIKNAKVSLAKDTKDRRAVIARLEADAAALSKKWLKGVGK